jgi:hypothetical protein
VKVTIVESPYTSPMFSRIQCVRYALWACADCDARGEAAFASHLFYTQFIPETKDGRERGLKYRDEIARRVMGTIAHYTDLGTSPGMFRGAEMPEQRQLTGEIRERWLRGEWPEGSIRPVVVTL